MRNKLYKIALAVFGIALALTFSCSSNDDSGSSSNDDSGSSSNAAPVTYNCPLNGGTVNIGSQVWMAENLNCDVNGSKCYDDNPANCAIYGRLYNWTTAKKVCPDGWHLPSKAEWEALKTYVGNDQDCINEYGYVTCDAHHLKATSLWSGGINLDTYRFAALPGGIGGGDCYYYGEGDCVVEYMFNKNGLYGYWWSATEYNNPDYAYSLAMLGNTWDAGFGYNKKSNDLLSVRCLKDGGVSPSSSSANPPSSSSGGGGSGTLGSCLIPGSCVNNIELEQCFSLGGSYVTSCGGGSSSSAAAPSTRCKDGQNGDYFCQWETGCHAIDPAYADPPGQTCAALISECNKWGKLFTNSTVEGEGKTCNGTAISSPSSSSAAPSTRCKDGQNGDYFCQWETGCYAIDPAYDTAGRSCSVMISECRSYGTLFVNSTVDGEGKTCNGTVAQ